MTLKPYSRAQIPSYNVKWCLCALDVIKTFTVIVADERVCNTFVMPKILKLIDRQITANYKIQIVRHLSDVKCEVMKDAKRQKGTGEWDEEW